jgi:hypothetical protein
LQRIDAASFGAEEAGSVKPVRKPDSGTARIPDLQRQQIKEAGVKQGTLTEGEGLVQLTSKLRESLFCSKRNTYFKVLEDGELN